MASVLYTMGRLDEAEKNARAALELPDTGDRRMTTTAYEVLVRIALARHDAAAARREAADAAKADPTFPLSTYVEAMIHYQQAQYREALPLFQETIKQLQAHTVTIQNLYYDTGDTLAHLGEAGQAEEAFRQEIGLSPANVRAHAGLAILYRSVGRAADADAAIADLLRTVPTSQGYAMAIRLRTIFGETARAAALRQEAVRRFGEPAVAREERALLPGMN